MPDDLAEQINWVHQACEAMGVPILTAAGYEADDVIGTVAMRARAQDFEVAIVSIDKDFFQMVGPGVRVYDPREDGAWFDSDGVVRKFGVRPEQVTDVLALVGDTSDNVAGVPGIGKKGAIDLVTQFGGLDAMLERLDELKPKQREALSTHRADALRSRELVTIRTDVPLDVDFESLTLPGAIAGTVLRVVHATSTSGPSSTTTRRRQRPHTPSTRTTRSSTSAQELDALIDELRQAGEFAFRVIPDQPSAMLARIVGIAFSTRDREARYVPLGHVNSDTKGDLLTSASAPTQVDTVAALDRLRPLFEDDAIRKVGHDLKFDTIVLARHGVSLCGGSFDSMLASYLLDATRGHLLEATSLEHLGYKPLTDEEVCGRGAKAVPFAQLAACGAADYAGERADLARQLSNRLGAAARRPISSSRSIASWKCRSIPVLADIERAGIRLDGPALAAQSRHLEQELAGYTARIFELAGEEFNINSPQQLGRDPVREAAAHTGQEDRQDTIGLDGRGRARGAGADARPAALVLEWRGLHKLKSTYIDALPLMVHPGNGPRAHQLQPGGRRDRTAEQLRSEPAEHSHPHRARPRDPPRVRRRARPRADLGGLFADRAARARAHGRRGGADRGVPHRRGHSRAHGAEVVRARTAASTPHELRSRSKMVNYARALRKDAVHAGQGHQRHPGGGAGVHRRLLRRLPQRARVHRSHARGGARRRASSRRCSDAGGWCRT